MKIIKLGGSLSHSEALLCCMDSVNRQRQAQRLVIVPGGGAFADQVRSAQQRWRFNQQAAHRMAILAMQQMALMFQALQPAWEIKHAVADLRQQAAAGTVMIWSPDIEELDWAGVPEGWDVTSDSLAAWLAAQLKAAELVLVKSAVIEPSATLAELQQQGVVDRAFRLFSDKTDCAITIKNQQQFSCIHC